MSWERKVVKSSNSVKLVFWAVKNFRRKPSNIFRPTECSFKTVVISLSTVLAVRCKIVKFFMHNV